MATLVGSVLLTDVETTVGYGVPFFYFSGKDFDSAQIGWIFGVLDVKGHSKPLRQDLQMGAVKLELSCSSGKFVVADQEQLLAKLYSDANCRLTMPARCKAENGYTLSASAQPVEVKS